MKIVCISDTHSLQQHDAYGQQQVGETLFVNPSMVDLAYRPVREAIVVEI